MTTETQTANERVALLLGWRWCDEPDCQADEDPHLLNPQADDIATLLEPPDYTSWSRFPELQEYFSGLDRVTREAVLAAILTRTVTHASPVLGQNPTAAVMALLDEITPTILRDAIDSGCGGE